MPIPFYFVRVLADGRRLEERLCRGRVMAGADAEGSEVPLITAEYALWTKPPFDRDDGTEARASRGGRDEAAGDGGEAFG